MIKKLRNEINWISSGSTQRALRTVADILEIMGAQEALDAHDAAIAKDEGCCMECDCCNDHVCLPGDLPPDGSKGKSEDQLLLEAEEKIMEKYDAENSRDTK